MNEVCKKNFSHRVRITNIWHKKSPFICIKLTGTLINHVDMLSWFSLNNFEQFLGTFDQFQAHFEYYLTLLNHLLIDFVEFDNVLWYFEQFLTISNWQFLTKIDSYGPTFDHFWPFLWPTDYCPLVKWMPPNVNIRKTIGYKLRT